MATLIDDPRLLDLLLADLAQQTDVYRPGPYWQGYAARMATAIRASGLEGFRAEPAIGRGFADVFASEATWAGSSLWRRPGLQRAASVPGIGALRRAHFRHWQRRERRQFAQRQARFDAELGPWFADFARRHALPDTLVGRPQRRLRLGGQEIGEIYLRVFAWVQDLSTPLRLDQVDSVFEIGGGFGSMAHTLLHLFPNIRKYVYLDIPPVLYVGSRYLRHFFGDAVRDYTQTRDLDRIAFAVDDRREILALAPWQIERLDVRTDLFWNSSSFQEMPPEVVRNYATHVARALDARSRVALYHYDDPRGAGATLSRGEIAGMFADATGRTLAPVPAPTAGRVLPGTLLLDVRSPTGNSPCG